MKPTLILSDSLGRVKDIIKEKIPGATLLSASRIETLFKCGLRYKFRYVDGRRTPPNTTLARGLVYHNTLRTLTNSHRIVPLRPALVPEMAADTFAAQFNQLEEVRWGSNEPGKVKDVGIAMSQQGAEKFVLPVQPDTIKAVEQSFVLVLPTSSGDKIALRGKRDLVVENGEGLVVWDHKTSSKLWSKAKARDGSQPWLYAFPEWYSGKQPPQFVYAVATEPGKKVGVRTRMFTPADDGKSAWRPAAPELDWWLGVLFRAHQVIKAGVFMPGASGWWCSKKWCDFYDICRGRCARSFGT